MPQQLLYISLKVGQGYLIQAPPLLTPPCKHIEIAAIERDDGIMARLLLVLTACSFNLGASFNAPRDVTWTWRAKTRMVCFLPRGSRPSSCRIEGPATNPDLRCSVLAA